MLAVQAQRSKQSLQAPEHRGGWCGEIQEGFLGENDMSEASSEGQDSARWSRGRPGWVVLNLCVGGGATM